MGRTSKPVTVHFTIPRTMRDELNRLARKEMITLSNLLRRMVGRYITSVAIDESIEKGE